MSYRNFYNLEFEVNDLVIKPYKLTESVVEKAIEMLREKKNPTFLDIGCGSGNIAVSILANVPNARGMAVDISQGAVNLTSINAKRHNVAVDRLDIRCSDVFENVDGKFDLIVCNSPYLTQIGEGTTPREAFTDDADGLTMIRQVVKDASNYLLENGKVLFEYAGGLNDKVWLQLGGAVILKDEIGRQFGAVFTN